MRGSLVYVSKAFDHATLSTLKNKNTKNHEHSLVHQRHKTMSNIYTITLQITISLFFCKSTILPYILQLKLYH